MPDPQTSVRPVGLGSTIWKVLGRPQTPDAPVAQPVAPIPGDTLTVTASPFANRRFAGHADLAAVHAGGVLRWGPTGRQSRSPRLGDGHRAFTWSGLLSASARSLRASASSARSRMKLGWSRSIAMLTQLAIREGLLESP